MSQPTLVPCPSCRRHVEAGAALCPFCGASRQPLGPGFGHPDDRVEGDPQLDRVAAPHYGMAPAFDPRRSISLYGLPPPPRARWRWALAAGLLVVLVGVAAGVALWLLRPGP